MKTSISALIILSITCITLFSCTADDQANEMGDVSENSDHTYEPGAEWELVWADEFEGDAINTNNWNYQVLEAGRFNEEWQRYTDSSDNAFVEDGNLVIQANHVSDKHGLDQYTSARMNTANKQSWQYGKITARIRLPYGQGIWPAFWMLGSNIDENGGDTPWPQSGEIDILELYGSKDNGVVEANIHFADASDSHAMMGAESYELNEGIFADSFHIFELEWDENRFAWSVDGEEYASTPITADEMSEFHKDFFILLNIAVGGTYAGYPDDTTEFPQRMYVDWVRVYQK
jgi:beta-glucanase (GH16 family)